MSGERPLAPKRSLTTWGVSLALLALGFWLRLTVLAPRELGLDGLLAVGIARLAPVEILAFSLRDVHPPLYYLGLAAWLELTGPSFLAARWPSLAAGLLALAVFTRLLAGRAGVPRPADTSAARAGQVDRPTRAAGLRSEMAARAGLALLAVSPAAVFLAATVRDFAFGVLLSLLCWYAFERARRPGGTPRSRRGWLAALAGLTAAALLTWYFHLLVLALQALALAWPAGRAVRTTAADAGATARAAARAVAADAHDAPVRWIVATLAAGSLVALPWYIVFLRQILAPGGGFGASGQAPQNVGLELFVTSAGRSLLGHLPGNLPDGILFPVWLTAVVAAFWVLQRRGATRAAALLAAGVALSLGAAYLLFRFWVGGDFLTRYFLLPAFFGGAGLAGALACARSQVARWLMAGILVLPGLMLYVDFQSLQNPEPERAAFQEWIAPRLSPGDRVVFDDLADLGYFWLAGSRGATPLVFHTAGAGFLRERSLTGIGRELSAAPAEGSVYHVRQTATPPERVEALSARLLERWQPVARSETAGRVVETYAGPARWQPAAARFGDRFELTGVNLPETLPASGPVPVVLRWRAVQAGERDYSVFVHLLDSSGRRIGQHDGPPGGGVRPTSTWQAGDMITDLHWLDIDPNRGSGPFQVVAGLYAGDTRLTLPDGSNAYPLGTIP